MLYMCLLAWLSPHAPLAFIACGPCAGYTLIAREDIIRELVFWIVFPPVSGYYKEVDDMCEIRLCSSALKRLRSENQGSGMKCDRPAATYRDTFYSRAGEKFAICFFSDGNECRCPEEACRSSRCHNLPVSTKTDVSSLYRGTSSGKPKHNMLVIGAIRRGNEVVVRVELDGRLYLFTLEEMSVVLRDFMRAAVKVASEITEDVECPEFIGGIFDE